MKKFSLWLITFLLRIYFRLTLRLDVTGLEKVPMRGPLIVISNHTGQVEVAVLATVLQPRKIAGWGKAEAFKIPLLRWVFWAWDIIPIHRGEADMSALKKALRDLEEDFIFGIAPEGTRNKTGILRRAMPGTAILAVRSGVPILPIVHWGGENFLQNLKQFKRTDFHLRVGELYTVKVDGKVTAETRQQIVDEMMCKIAELIPEEYRGEYRDLGKFGNTFLVKLENGSSTQN